MNWTKQRPHVSGYYWLLEADREPCIVEIRAEKDRRIILMTGDSRPYPIEIVSKALWCGPLDPC